MRQEPGNLEFGYARVLEPDLGTVTQPAHCGARVEETFQGVCSVVDLLPHPGYAAATVAGEKQHNGKRALAVRLAQARQFQPWSLRHPSRPAAQAEG